jgi:hypothetical protein
VRSIKSDIISAAKFHARAADGFDWEVMAALMGAHIAREKRGERWLVDNVLDPIKYLKTANVSTGIANTRPETVVDILNGVIPLPNSETASQDYALMYRDAFSQCSRSNGDVEKNDANYRLIHDQLQSTDIALDILGANIERGIDRAKLLSLTPSVFNLGNWLWSGVQEPAVWWEGIATGKAYDPLITHGAEPYGYEQGFVMVQNIGQAAQELGISPLSSVNLYNKNPGDAAVDESIFVECELRYSPIMTFIQNPNSRMGFSVNEVKDGYRQNAACGKTQMTHAEFEQQYGAVLKQFGIP